MNVVPLDESLPISDFEEIRRYCAKTDGTPATPEAEKSCEICQTEADCGNADPVTGLPNRVLQWCLDQVDDQCLNQQSSVEMQHLEKPSFKFTLKPQHPSEI
jgi:hypothetical protein